METEEKTEFRMPRLARVSSSRECEAFRENSTQECRRSSKFRFGYVSTAGTNTYLAYACSEKHAEELAEALYEIGCDLR